MLHQGGLCCQFVNLVEELGVTSDTKITPTEEKSSPEDPSPSYQIQSLVIHLHKIPRSSYCLASHSMH